MDIARFDMDIAHYDMNILFIQKIVLFENGEFSVEMAKKYLIKIEIYVIVFIDAYRYF